MEKQHGVPEFDNIKKALEEATESLPDFYYFYVGGIVKSNEDSIDWEGGMGCNIPNPANDMQREKTHEVFLAFSEEMENNKAAALFIHYASKYAKEK